MKKNPLSLFLLSGVILFLSFGFVNGVYAQSGEVTSTPVLLTTPVPTSTTTVSTETSTTTITTTTTTEVTTTVTTPTVDADGKFNGKYILYVQEGCSHCTKVESFIGRNNLWDKIEIRDIKKSESAYNEFIALSNKYKVDAATPLMEAKGQALLGDEPINTFLGTEFNATNTQDPADVFITIGFIVLVAIFLYGIVSSIKKN